MVVSYKIDKVTSELWIIDDLFVTRLKDYVCLAQQGHYLFYDSNMAISAVTDFRSRLEITGEYRKGTSSFFKTSTIHFGDDGILVFGLSPDHSSINEDKPIQFNVPIKKSSSGNSFFSCSRSSTRMFGSVVTEVGYDTYMFTRSMKPIVVTPGPMGYVIGGYNLYVIIGKDLQPSSYIVYDVNGNETQEPMVKLNVV